MSSPCSQLVPIGSLNSPDPLRQAVQQSVRKFQVLAEAILAGKWQVSCPEELLAFERSLHRDVAKECLDPITAAVIQASHENPLVVRRTRELADSCPDVRRQKTGVLVRLTLLGGSTMAIETDYYLRRPPRGPGRRRARGRRGKRGNGQFPTLEVLGIHDRVSPALASEIARQMAISTVEEARGNLAERGIELGTKVVWRLANRIAERGLAYRTWKQETVKSGVTPSLAAGKRLVIGLDGGRIRTRVNLKGRRRKSGHSRFEAPWREPKVLVVYEVGDDGRRKRGGLVRYDATLQDADGILLLLVSTLRELGAAEATEWVIVGDGAGWIWDRIEELIAQLGFDRARVTEVVDFYHAVQRIHAVAEELKGWRADKKVVWTKQMRRKLLRGQLVELREELHQLCRGRNAKRIRSLIRYFDRHAARMNYADYKQRRIPLGSGAVESCIRRVVNLRLKGNGIFWAERRAEGLLHTRAQLLSGQWNRFIQTILQPRPFWALPARGGAA